MAEITFAYHTADDVDPTKRRVRRVIVVENAELAARLTGTRPEDWVETKQDDPVERYAGIGDFFDSSLREKFDLPPERKPRS